MPLAETVLIVAGLLTVAMLAAGLCRRLPIPYTVVLVVIGMALGELARGLPGLEGLASFGLSPDVVFFLFLPALIFESGFNLDARQLVKELAPVLMLAVPALLASSALVGLGLWLTLGVAPVLALLFGALISATDPVAVVALFKELGAPSRLTVLVEGESLLNDATAIVTYRILLGIVLGAGALGPLGVAAAALDFVRVFIGGALVGVVLGVLASELLYRTRSTVSAILTMTLVLAYAAFIVAEHLLDVSGVMASAAGAVTLGVLGTSRMPQRAVAAIGETWELIALICNSLLFLLVGMSVDPVGLVLRAGPIGLAVALVLVARAATVYTLVPLTTRLFPVPRVSSGERHIMWWGGLKGGLAIAIALSIPEDLPGRALIIDLTLGVVLFTLLVNAPTIRPLMHRLGLDRLSPDEHGELAHALGQARARALATLARFRDAGVVSTATGERVAREAGALFEGDTPAVDSEQVERHAYAAALRTELAALAELRDLGVLSQYVYLDLRNAVQRDREARLGREGGVAAAAPFGESPFQRLENALLRRLREHDWAARLLARYQGARLAQRLERDIAGVLASRAVLEMLAAREDLDAAQRGAIAGPYEQRLAARSAHLETLRHEFPEFYRGFEARLAARSAYIGAANEIERRSHDGEIGAKVEARIERRIEQALAALPGLDRPAPRPAPSELIALVPLLSGLSEASLQSLAAHASAVTVLARDVIIGEGDKGDALYIVMRGELRAVRRDEGGEPHELGRLREGDFFGETALLGDHLRTATVEALAPSTLLRLARRDVLALAAGNPEVEARLREVR